MRQKEQERQKTPESSFALKRTVCMSVFPPDPTCSPGPEWGNRVFIAVKTSEVLRKKIFPRCSYTAFLVSYAVRVPSVSFLKLSRSQQTSSCSCTIPHSASYQACKPPPASLCSGSSNTESVSELQALTDTAAGFLIGSRDGGNGLKKLESTSRS